MQLFSFLFVALSAACRGGVVDGGDDEEDPILPHCGRDLPCTGFLPDGTVTWRASDGPYLVVDTLHADTLIIEAGTVVVGASDAIIVVKSRLIASGTAAAPVLFVAADATQPWGGLRGSVDLTHVASLELRHVIMEHARTGVTALVVRVSDSGPFPPPWIAITIDSSTFRQIHGGVLVAGTGGGTIRESLIESPCLGNPDCYAVSGAGVTMRNTVIRNSGGHGVGVFGGNRGGHIVLDGGRIEGSAGVGLSSSWHVGATAGAPVTITGGGSYPANVSLPVAAALAGTPERQELWTGNARDTIRFTQAWVPADTIVVGPHLFWSGTTLGASITIHHLTLEAGADWRSFSPMNVRRLVSRGTAAYPVRISGWIRLAPIAATDTSFITHTYAPGVTIQATGSPVVFDSFVADHIQLRLPAGSRGTRFVFRGGSTALPMVQIQGDNVHLSDCVVTGGSGPGIQVEAAGARISGCSIHGNAGPGVRNTFAGAVDARHNWWGDAAGPAGASGDGVEGAVEYTPWLTAPPALNASLPGLLAPNGFRAVLRR